ncbi:MAG: hypothetical protein JXB85_14875 [Anaerolineales bacterium]|nr:hypothetical protein [Anaerolineales bacterium]
MNRARFGWKNVLVVVGLVLLVMLMMNFNRRMAEYDALDRQRATVRGEGTAIMQTQVALMTAVSYASSTEAVEEWAYVEGRWVRPGEEPVVPIPAENVTPTPAPPPTQVVSDVPNWQIWWELFFSDP